MLTEYTGPSNSRDVFQFLVGEKIVAAFQTFEERTQVWLVLESGDAIVFAGGVSTKTGPAFWREPKERVDRPVSARRAEIERTLSELRDLPGVPLP